MLQTEIAETLLEELVKLFNSYIKIGKRPNGFLIRFENQSFVLKKFIAEIDANGLTPRVRRYIQLTDYLIENWDNKVYLLPKSEEPECLFFTEDGNCWLGIINKKNTVQDWHDKHQNAEYYSFDQLLNIANEVNGYCGQLIEMLEKKPSGLQPQPTDEEIKKPSDCQIKAARAHYEGRIINTHNAGDYGLSKHQRLIECFGNWHDANYRLAVKGAGSKKAEKIKVLTWLLKKETGIKPGAIDLIMADLKRLKPDN